MRHIHLDLVGGLSGDMFSGALLDCFPDLASDLPDLLRDAGFAELVSLGHEPANDGILTGTRFTVTAGSDAEHHHHRHYSDIRERIANAGIADGTKRHALEIFHAIAVVEAEIHGKAVDAVAFHEVGAWDSIADILCAAHLIATLQATWSVGRIPLGRGRVRTAHGPLPVPAPATARLLEGFAFIDDGIEGERVTPTGAAILKQLAPVSAPPAGALLERSGYGFGTKTFEGISNVTRALVFAAAEDTLWRHDQVVQLAFEIDDDSPEAVAVAAEHLRQLPGVVDLVTASLMGKKGRAAIGLRLLVTPAHEQAVINSCFTLTTTLGIRREQVARVILPRLQVIVRHGGNDYRVKVAVRPGGATAKVEMDDLVRYGGDRMQIEAIALQQYQQQDNQ